MDMNTGTCREVAVHGALNRLQAAVEELGKVKEQLLQRLAAVSRAEPATSLGPVCRAPAEQELPACPLSHQIDDSRRQLTMFVSNLRDAMSLLEI